MRLSIFIRDNNFGEKEITKEIDEKDYNEFKEDIMKGKVKFVDIDNRLIRISEIKRIEPTGEQTIPESFRLKQPEFKSIDTAGRMKELWNLLKGKGLFERVSSYDEFRNRKGY